jgi:hypothetical protein
MRGLLSIFSLSLAAAASAAPITCGVASADFPSYPLNIAGALQAGQLDFWWNWATTTTLDEAGFSGVEQQLVLDK